jgi:hypothetical protein
MVDLCLGFTAHVETPVPITNPHGITAVVMISYDEYGFCDQACKIEFTHIGRYTGQVTGELWDTNHNWSTAKELPGTYKVNQNVVMGVGGAVDPPGNGFQSASFNQPYAGSMTIQPGLCCPWFESQLDTSAQTTAHGSGKKTNTANVYSSFLFATHASATECAAGPNGVVSPLQTVQWDYHGLNQGNAQVQSLRSEIQGFFLNNWGILTNP